MKLNIIILMVFVFYNLCAVFADDIPLSYVELFAKEGDKITAVKRINYLVQMSKLDLLRGSKESLYKFDLSGYYKKIFSENKNQITLQSVRIDKNYVESIFSKEEKGVYSCTIVYERSSSRDGKNISIQNAKVFLSDGSVISSYRHEDEDKKATEIMGKIENEIKKFNSKEIKIIPDVNEKKHSKINPIYGISNIGEGGRLLYSFDFHPARYITSESEVIDQLSSERLIKFMKDSEKLVFDRFAIYNNKTENVSFENLAVSREQIKDGDSLLVYEIKFVFLDESAIKKRAHIIMFSDGQMMGPVLESLGASAKTTDDFNDK